MKNIIHNITIWFFLSVLLFPTVVKILHKHEHNIEFKVNHERHFDEHSLKCEICDFVLSFFYSEQEIFCFKSVLLLDFYLNLYSSEHILKPFFLISLLRAPPVNN